MIIVYKKSSPRRCCTHEPPRCPARLCFLYDHPGRSHRPSDAPLPPQSRTAAATRAVCCDKLWVTMVQGVQYSPAALVEQQAVHLRSACSSTSRQQSADDWLTCVRADKAMGQAWTTACCDQHRRSRIVLLVVLRCSTPAVYDLGHRSKYNNTGCALAEADGFGKHCRRE